MNKLLTKTTEVLIFYNSLYQQVSYIHHFTPKHVLSFNIFHQALSDMVLVESISKKEIKFFKITCLSISLICYISFLLNEILH